MLRERGDLTKKWTFGAIGVFLIYAAYFAHSESINGVLFILQATPAMCVLLISQDLIKNVVRLPEELSHCESRYGNSYSCVLEMTLLSRNKRTYWFVILSVFIALLVNGFSFKHWLPLPYVMVFYAVSVFMNYIDTRYTDLNMRLDLEKCGMDYGAGMAYSFYYGYLHIVLPDRGTAEKGIAEKIKVYENKNGVHVQHKKLFILIPSTGVCPPDLSALGDGWIEPGESLEVLEQNVSGVQRRPYKNSVYKMRPSPRQKPTYIVMEGATPVKTFHENTAGGFESSAFYKKHEKEIIYRFYVTLKYILQNCPEGDLCVPVYYESRDANGQLVNVAQKLLREYFNYDG